MEPIEGMSATNRKRQREDKIGKLMGDYLLKGYKMLSNTCNHCGTILLRDRKNQDYCVGCCEVDKQATPATPVSINEPSTSLEQHGNLNPDKSSIPHSTANLTNKAYKDVNNGSSDLVQALENHEPHFQKCIENSTMKLEERILWATSQLGCGNCVEMDIKLSELIYTCGKALKTLRKLQK